MKFNLKEKMKNYGFWTSLGAAVILFVQNLGNLFGFSVDSAIIDGIVSGLCGILVVLGIINNPKEGKWFADGTAKEGEQSSENEQDLDETKNQTTETTKIDASNDKTSEGE